MPNASRLTAELEPQYGANRLAGLYVRLKGDKDILDVDYKEQTLLEYKGLLRMLKTRYGATAYPHKSRNDQAQSWFNGPIEIEAQYSEMYGIRMYYKDLRHYGQYLREFVEQYEREQAADKIRQAKQASRL